MGKLCSEEVVSVWSDEKKKKILHARYERNKIVPKTAFFILLITGLAGGHRIYLGQWKRGLLVCLIFASVFIPWNFFIEQELANISELKKQLFTSAFGLVVLMIFVYEGFRLVKTIEAYNNKLHSKLSSDLGFEND